MMHPSNVLQCTVGLEITVADPYLDTSTKVSKSGYGFIHNNYTLEIKKVDLAC
jgi:hypothetical protein